MGLEGSTAPAVSLTVVGGKASYQSIVSSTGKPDGTIKYKVWADDKSARKADTKSMSQTIDPNILASISAIEERMDKRVERMASEFQREMALRDEAFQRETAARNEALKAHITRTDEMGARLERQFSKAEDAIGAQKYWLAGIGVAVVLGIMGANATIFSGGKAFFDGGVDRASVMSVLEETRAQTKQTQQLLEQIKAQQATSLAVPESPSQPPRPQQ